MNEHIDKKNRMIFSTGKSHLACVTYAGDKPILRRRNLAAENNYIQNDINVLSHYNRFRQAAEKAAHVPDTGTFAFELKKRNISFFFLIKTHLHAYRRITENKMHFKLI